MNNIKEMENTHSAESSTPAKVRVAAYVRVDSGSQEQHEHLNAQVDAYTKYISAHDGWELVDIYADDGPAGEDASCRKEFNRMLQDCRAGKKDHILARSASRFSRNLQECSRSARELLKMGVTVYFEKEDLDTGNKKFEQTGTVCASFSHAGSAGHLPNQGNEWTFTLTMA